MSNSIDRNKEYPNLSLNAQRWIVAGAAALFALIFMVIGFKTAGPGFPLDDAWIHQTYARNLALTGKWEFIQGQVSGGSTSPLWTMLLSVGPLIGFKNPFFWTGLLSIGLFTGLTLTAYEIIRRVASQSASFVGALLIALEWHLLWSSSSGMETILFCFLCLFLFYKLLEGKDWLWVGFLSGLIVWVRPDGITMLGPVLLITIWRLIRKELPIKKNIGLILPIILLLFLYGWFNYSITGMIFPNTLYAKQLEYADALNQSFFLRLGLIFLVPISGAGLFLIPGFMAAVRQAFINRNVWLASAILWVLGYGGIYMFRLPMVYQHGRYIIPLIPVFFLIGIIGTVYLFQIMKVQKQKWLSFARTLVIASGLVSAVFAISGTFAFIADLRTIDRLMVEPAKWIRLNTPRDALIAAHDIGAMGYFGDRNIIDLAGLIQPDIIPIIRNEDALREFINDHNADYLVVFRDWYPNLVDFGETVKQFVLTVNGETETVEIRVLKD